MANILRIGLLLATFTLVTLLVQPSDADDVKKKRVIIKIPTRIKHVYHHHTKKIHIHKKKPKTKPESVHVVHVEEETQVKPIKSWKSIESQGRSKKSKKSKWSPHSLDWNSPKGFTSSKESQEEYAASGEQDYYHTSEEDYGRGYEEFDYGTKKKKRSRGKPRTPYEYEDPYYEGSNIKENRKPSRPPYRPSKNTYRPKRPTKRPKNEDLYIGPEDYEDYHKGVWPETKEHPSWHQRKQNKNWSPPVPAVTEESHEDPPKYDKPKENFEPERNQNPTEAPVKRRPGSGYRSEVAQGPDGTSIGYQAHIGHSSDASKPSSSFQSVRFGHPENR